MAKVKGTVLKNAVNFLKGKVGEEGFETLLQGMAPEDAEVLRVPVLPSEWYEFSLLRRLMQQAEGKVPVAPGRTVAWEMGQNSAEVSFKGIYKLFFKVMDLGFIAKKAPYLFGGLYNTGEMELVDLQPNSVTLRVKGFDEPSREFCDRIQGWMQRTVEIAGRKNVRMEHTRCRLNGDAHCDYVERWD